MKELGTDLRFSSAYHPQTDGQTKAVNRSLGNLLRSLVKNKPKQWDMTLPHAKFAYNSSRNRSTQRSPFEIVYGANPTNVLDLVPIQRADKVSEDAEELARCIKDIHQEVRKKIEASNAKYKEAADLGHLQQLFKV